MATERLSMQKTREILRHKWVLGLGYRVHKRIEGGISGPKTRAALCHHTFACAWSALRSGFDGAIRVPNGLSQSQGVVHPITAPERSCSVQPVSAATRLQGRRARWA